MINTTMQYKMTGLFFILRQQDSRNMKNAETSAVSITNPAKIAYVTTKDFLVAS